MEYNTTKEKLILPEYGRTIQDMVAYAMTLTDRAERQHCAETIISIMGKFNTQSKDRDEKLKMLWDHLALISNYKLDVDSPYPITIITDEERQQPHVEYPHRPTRYRHYGATLEAMVQALPSITDPQQQHDATLLILSQMAKSLWQWNRNILTPQKLADDLHELSDGKITLTLPEENLHKIITAAAALAPKTQHNRKKKK